MSGPTSLSGKSVGVRNASGITAAVTRVSGAGPRYTANTDATATAPAAITHGTNRAIPRAGATTAGAAATPLGALSSCPVASPGRSAAAKSAGVRNLSAGTFASARITAASTDAGT